MSNLNNDLPLSDTAYDIVSIVYQKSKALEVYRKFERDLEDDDHLKKILQEITADEKRHLEKLVPELGRLILQPETMQKQDSAVSKLSPRRRRSN